jgi:hypothetical protein
MSKNPLVGRAMAEAADDLLKDRMAATLSKEEVRHFNKLDLRSAVELPDGKPDANRRTELERQDREHRRDPEEASGRELSEPVDPEEVDEVTRDLLELQAAFKTVQIIGQTVRNNAGARHGEQKQMLLRASFLLSRRIIGFVFSTLDEDNLDALREDWSRILRDEHPELSENEVGLKVDERMLSLTQFLVFVVAKHLASSSAAEILAPTLKRIVGDEKVAINDLFGLALKLERPGSFPVDDAVELHEEHNGNMFNQTVLRLLVRHHLYLFTVSERNRQRACSKLDITPTKRMLIKGTKRLA